MIARDKTEIAIEQSAAPLCDARGRLQGAILVFRDITGRRQLEEQLSHARKMDAVGRLAGGVAGDFNNVLTVITGYSDMLRAQIPAASPLRRFADEILYAGERAAALTRQLLTFSSGQASQPKVTDLNSADRRHATHPAPHARRIRGVDGPARSGCRLRASSTADRCSRPS